MGSEHESGAETDIHVSHVVMEHVMLVVIMAHHGSRSSSVSAETDHAPSKGTE